MQVSNVVTTAIWEMKLKQVAEGKEDIRAFYKEIMDFTADIVNDIFSKEIKVQINSTAEKKSLGTCPKCEKGNVFEGKKSFGCSEWKQGCDFTIWKTIAGKKVTSSVVKDLISNKTKLLKGFKSKKGNKLDAYLVLEKDCKVRFEFKKQT